MAAPVVHFEIHGKDQQKLIDFYNSQFDWNVQGFEMPGGGSYGMVQPAEGSGGMGIGGGVSGSDQTMVTVYIEVPDINARLAEIEKAGGKVVMPRTEIPGAVIMAMFSDPEGNVVGLVEPGTPAA